eukprot:TRINITY_DN52214_c0_g1_i1.p1 TRINITY_DN52214_c0_g1~~TRINITY_DN52214_c0_g1_i1.p1  ORF type:complete len:389 (+),score=49.72 TRINITY_DN52214_c0_g1_i1:131-1168(+)
MHCSSPSMAEGFAAHSASSQIRPSASSCSSDRRGQLRLIQYNVRGFTSASGACGLDHICSSLRALRPSVVCLNEVDLRKQPQGLKRVAEASGLSHVHFFGHVQGRYGNALLSRFPILRVKEVHLNGGTELEWPKGSGNMRRIRRGMLLATLAVPEGPGVRPNVSSVESGELTVISTHLDHMDEAERLVQISHALDEMRTLPSPHILAGDLNALLTDDYSATEWASVEQKAFDNGWKMPSDATCVRFLLGKGYVDAFRLANENGKLPLPANKFTAHTTRPMYRIDYALLSPCALRAGITVERAFVDTSANGSDHFPLVVDLSWGDSSRYPGEPPEQDAKACQAAGL